MGRDEIFGWCKEAVVAARDGGGRACVLALNGPQGAGKTTLARELEAAFARSGMRAVAVSVDDFYLTASEQRAVAERSRGNRYLQQRGYPGTHDVELGARILDALRALRAGAELKVPIYDKSVAGGRGDRKPVDEWRTVVGPVDVVIFEGWMLGFEPVGARRVGGDAELAVIDAELARYAPWRARIDAMIQLRMARPEYVVEWRADAEAAMRRAGKDGMSDEAVRQYAALFLPAYAVYPDELERNPPVRERHLVLVVERDRTMRRRG
jgi:D-glycerate 3-kinase